MLGIISDVRFPLGGEKNPGAGLKFASMVRKKNPFLPIIMESSEAENRDKVREC